MRIPNTLRLSAPLELRASAGAKLPSKFDGRAYTGKAVHGGSCVIDVQSTTVPTQMALLAEHDRGQVIGLVESSRKDGGTIVVAGSLYSDVAGSSAERIARLAVRGFPYQMSVGLFDFTENDVPKGTKATVNGQEFAGPLTILRNGKVRECSIVALGADANTTAMFFGANTRGRDEAIARLFAEVGAETVCSEEWSAFSTMSAAEFALVSDVMRRTHINLTRERLAFDGSFRAAGLRRQPMGGSEEPAKAVNLSASAIYAARRASQLKH